MHEIDYPKISVSTIRCKFLRISIAIATYTKNNILIDRRF